MPLYRHNPYQLSFEKALFFERPEFDPEQSPTRPPNEDGAEVSALEEATLPVFGVQLVREGQFALPQPPCIQCPQDAVRVFAEFLAGKDREHFVILILDTKNQVRGIHTVSIGILDTALVHPREVFKVAILANSASLILCHNHPSGDPTPSAEDKRVTERLAEVGRLIGIDVMDHVILGDHGRFKSLKEMGVL